MYSESYRSDPVAMSALWRIAEWLAPS